MSSGGFSNPIKSYSGNGAVSGANKHEYAFTLTL